MNSLHIFHVWDHFHSHKTLFLVAKVVLEHDNYPFKKLGGFVNKVTACDLTVLVFQIVYDKLKWIGSGEYQMTQLFLVLFTK